MCTIEMQIYCFCRRFDKPLNSGPFSTMSYNPGNYCVTAATKSLHLINISGFFSLWEFDKTRRMADTHLSGRWNMSCMVQYHIHLTYSICLGNVLCQIGICSVFGNKEIPEWAADSQRSSIQDHAWCNKLAAYVFFPCVERSVMSKWMKQEVCEL